MVKARKDKSKVIRNIQIIRDMTSYGGMGDESESLADDFRVAENETLKMDERREKTLSSSLVHEND